MTLGAPYRAALLAALLAACDGDSGAPEPPTPVIEVTTGVALSPPLDEAAGAVGTVILVSAVTGTMPRAASATMRNARTGERRTVSARDGGFDPEPLGASLGDAVLVSLRDSAGGETAQTVLVARAPRPRLVRTSPQPRQTDVPLNVVIEVVVSTPVPRASAAAAIRLERGGAAVGGTVRVAAELMGDEAGTHLLVEPVEPLAARTEYVLHVDESLRDVVGGTLGVTLSVPFVTGDDADAGVDSLRIGIRHGATFGMVVDDSLGLAAYAWASGLPTRRTDVTWQSSDASVVRLEPVQPRVGNEFLMGVRAVGEGRAVVRASAAGLTDSMVLDVGPALSATPPAGRLLLGTADGIWAVDVGGGNLVRLTGEGAWPTVSNGGRLAYLVGDTTLRLREVDGTERTLLAAAGDYLLCPHFLPDGEHVLVTQLWEDTERRRWELTLLATATATTRVLASTDWYFHGNQPFPDWGADEACASVSPDGRWVAHVRLPAEGWSSTWIMDLEGGDARRLLDGYWPRAWSPDGALLTAVRVDPSFPALRPALAIARTTDGAIVGGDAEFRYPGPHAWAPDGLGFVYVEYLRGVVYRSALGGTTTLPVGGVPAEVRSAGFLPPSASAALEGR